MGGREKGNKKTRRAGSAAGSGGEKPEKKKGTQERKKPTRDIRMDAVGMRRRLLRFIVSKVGAARLLSSGRKFCGREPEQNIVAAPGALCELPRMSQFQDRVVVVTGAGRGIGKEIAKAFVARGAKVAVASRTEANANATAAELDAMGPGSAKGYAVDIASHDATVEFGKQVAADLGAVSILVNNAGVTRDGLALRMSEDDWDTVLDTNLKGAFNAVKAFQRSLLKAEDARIINISSVIGLMGNAGQCNYAASKAGLIGFTKALAKEFAGRKVCVNAIAPGFIVTDMTDELTPEMQEGIKKTIPLGCFGETEDIANAVLFLAGREARYITGQVLTVDGGMVM